MATHVSGLGNAPTSKPLEDGDYVLRVKTATIEEKVSKENKPYAQVALTYEILEGVLQQGKFSPVGRIQPRWIFVPQQDSDFYESNLSRFKTDLVDHGLDEERITDDLDDWMDDLVGLKVIATLKTKTDKNGYDRQNWRVKPCTK